MTNALMAGIASATQHSVDMTKAGSGGGEYVPPAAGPCRLRLVGYIEVGQHESEYDGVKKEPYEVQLVFELSGPKHEPKVLDDGTKIPYRMTVYSNAAKGGYGGVLNEKATLFKLFKRLNWEGKHQHLAQMVGEAFRGTVVHKTGKDGKVRAYLKDEGGLTIQPPRYEDPETGESKQLQVDPAISPLRVFLWNAQMPHLKAMWDSLFIDGEYEATETLPAKSKNVLQNKIKDALNFAGSPIAAMLAAGGKELSLGKSDPLAQPANAPAVAAPAPSDSPVTQPSANPATLTPSPSDPADPLAGLN